MTTILKTRIKYPSLGQITIFKYCQTLTLWLWYPTLAGSLGMRDLACDPVAAYLCLSPTEVDGAYFRGDMYRIAVLAICFWLCKTYRLAWIFFSVLSKHSKVHRMHCWLSYLTFARDHLRIANVLSLVGLPVFLSYDKHRFSKRSCPPPLPLWVNFCLLCRAGWLQEPHLRGNSSLKLCHFGIMYYFSLAPVD